MERARRAWLWLLFLYYFCSLIGSGTAFFGGITPMKLFVLAVNLLFFTGVLFLLFANKKSGFYMMTLSTLIGIVYNGIILLINMKDMIRLDIFVSVCYIFISMAVPVITYLFLRKDWDELE